MGDDKRNAIVKLKGEQTVVADGPKLLPPQSFMAPGGAKMTVRFTEDMSTFFMSAKDMAEAYGVQRSAIDKHIRGLAERGEVLTEQLESKLDSNSKRGPKQALYDEDAFYLVGFMVNSEQGRAVRRYAIQLMKERRMQIVEAAKEQVKLSEAEKSELRRTLSNIHVSVARIGDVSEVSKQVQSLIKAVARAEYVHPKKIEGAIRREFKGAGGYKLIAAQSASQVVSFLTGRLLAATTNQMHPTIPGIELGYDPHVNLRKPKSS